MSTLATTGPRTGRLPPEESLLFGGGRRRKVLTLFGTRPEVIKLAPVIRRLEARRDLFGAVNVTSAQHTNLLYPLLNLLDVRLDYDLRVMSEDQSPNMVCSRVLAALDRVLADERPDLVLVQGDTATAHAGALAAFQRRIPVGHVEAGLRSHDPLSPFPEEMNRRLITRLATYHFAATEQNRATLLDEGVAPESIFVTGNPVVDSLLRMTARAELTPATEQLLAATEGRRRIVLTTHRRESLGEVMRGHLKTLGRFVETHGDVALVFPVHPNPSVLGAAREVLAGRERVHLVEPMLYDQFVALLGRAWLVVSDSGGVQEEAPTLGRPLLILRENTERPEALEAGVARLVGRETGALAAMLEEAYGEGSWAEGVGATPNPFGDGESGARIVAALARVLCDAGEGRDARGVR